MLSTQCVNAVTCATAVVRHCCQVRSLTDTRQIRKQVLRTHIDRVETDANGKCNHCCGERLFDDAYLRTGVAGKHPIPSKAASTASSSGVCGSCPSVETSLALLISIRVLHK